VVQAVLEVQVVQVAKVQVAPEAPEVKVQEVQVARQVVLEENQDLDLMAPQWDLLHHSQVARAEVLAHDKWSFDASCERPPSAVH